MLKHPFKLLAGGLVDIVERFIVANECPGPNAAGVGAFNVSEVVQNEAAHVFPLNSAAATAGRVNTTAGAVAVIIAATDHDVIGSGQGGLFGFRVP